VRKDRLINGNINDNGNGNFNDNFNENFNDNDVQLLHHLKLIFEIAIDIDF